MSTILLIEDDRWLAELYRDVLDAAGYSVVHAEDAQQGIECLDDEAAVDLIVLDMMLPGPNGVALLHELRSYPDVADIPVIIHSALSSRQSGVPEGAWRAYGVVDYVSKVSHRPQDLVRAVRKALSHAAI